MQFRVGAIPRLLSTNESLPVIIHCTGFQKKSFMILKICLMESFPANSLLKSSTQK